MTQTEAHRVSPQDLQRGELALEGQFVNSSNYTFLVLVTYKKQAFTTVYKPTRGERPLWDFPGGSLAKREIAAYQVSEALGWELVPLTVCRRNAPLGPGSLQVFVEHDPEYHYFNFSPQDRQRLRSTVLFDLLVNNADRKGGHILRDPQDHLWLIDHGVCFHHEEKLRTVLWDFAGEPIPPDLLKDLRRFVEELECREGLFRRLRVRLSAVEMDALIWRAQRLLESGIFPAPDENRRPYPWPPL
jgi:uncharacterized repeat protein (TIGR03843 family)